MSEDSRSEHSGGLPGPPVHRLDEPLNIYKSLGGSPHIHTHTDTYIKTCCWTL